LFLDQISNAGSLPALEAAMRFASQRQKLIAHNIANFETPNFIPTDVSPGEFQKVLAEAVDSRREKTGGMHGKLSIKRTRELQQSASGSLTLSPRTPVGGVLAQDKNASNLERTMQDLVENAVMFRVAADLHRARAGIIKKAIGERAA
jgi:flagellar basal-body rod protein FlgB